MKRVVSLSLISSALLLNQAFGAGASSKHWRAAIKEAEQARVNRDFAKARSILESEAAEAAELGSEVAAQNSGILAGVLTQAGEYNDALEVLSAAIEKLGPNPRGKQQQVWRGLLLGSQAETANLAGRTDEALKLAEQARTVIEDVIGINHPQLFVLDALIAETYAHKRNYPEAEKAYLRALKRAETRRVVTGSAWSGAEEELHMYRGKDSTEGLLRMNTALGDLEMEQNKVKEAEEYYKAAIKIAEQSYGKKHQAVLLPLEGLARVHLQTNRRKEFEADVDKAFDLDMKAPGLAPWAVNPLWLKLVTDLKEGADPQPTADKITQVFVTQNFDTAELGKGAMRALSVEKPIDWGRIEKTQKTFRSVASARYSAQPAKIAPMIGEFARVAEQGKRMDLARENYEFIVKSQENTAEKGLLIGSLGKIADTYVTEKKPAEALTVCQRITGILRDKYGDDSRVANAVDREADLLKELSRDAEADATRKKSRGHSKSRFPEKMISSFPCRNPRF